MAEFQRMNPAGIGAQPRTSFDLAPRVSGANSTAAQLADALGVALDLAPKIATVEGEKAYNAGVEARVLDQERENANDANNGLFSGLFRKRAEDGFDHQDAMIDVSEFALMEQVEMYEALGESTDPKAYAAWAAQADARLKERINGQSDVYKLTLAKEMLPLREQQARTFAGWVVSNRERAKRQAAAASAKAAANAAVMAKEATAGAAYEALRSGQDDLNEVFVKFVTEAPAKLGVSPADAREIFTSELLLLADERNDDSILRSVDTRIFSPKGREAVIEATDKIAAQRATHEARAREAEEREARALEEQAETQRQATTFDLLGQVARREISLQDGINTLMATPAFKGQAAKLDTAMGYLTGMQSKSTDPVASAIMVTGAQTDMLDAVLTGGNPDEILSEALPYLDQGSIVGMLEFRKTLQDTAEAKALDGIEGRERELDRVFASGTGTDAQQYAFQIGGQGGRKPIDPGTAEDAKAFFRKGVIEYSAEWLMENPNNNIVAIPRSKRVEIQQRAFEETLKEFGVNPDEMSGQALAAQENGIQALNDKLGITK